MHARQEELRRRLAGLGFDDVRFVATATIPAETLRPWLAAGMHADMSWMERTTDKRLDPQLVLPGVRSIVMLGVNYWSDTWHAPRGHNKPVWAKFAQHDDYHDTIKPALVAGGRVLEELYGVGEADYRYYVDTGPVLERSWSARAGIGFVGKNAMLISRQHGNWLLLAAILTRIEFIPDTPVREKIRDAPVGLLCGKCTQCLDACPTQAFTAPGTVDARRCISYQTIENKGAIPRELRAGIGAHIFGCDVCLDVCPWNRFAREGRRLLLSARREFAELKLEEILELTAERFAEVFRRTPIKRLKLTGLLRNTCIVAGNSGNTNLLPQLVRLAEHESALVRAHAVWAVRRLGGASLLVAIQASETNAAVLAEYAVPI